MDKNKKAFSMGIIVVLSLVISIFICLMFDFELFYGMGASCLVAAVCAKLLGFSPKEILKMSVKNVKNVSPIAIMLFLIGATIGLWLYIGVIPTFVYYGLKYLSGINMVLLAFLLCSVMSSALGTAMGTLTTLGIVFMGIAQALSISMPLMAGAIIGGCYLGDRTAPISGIVNLTATMTGTDMIGNVKYMLKYTLGGIGISAVLYAIVGAKYTAAGDMASVTSILDLLSNKFQVSFLMVTPLLLMVALVLLFKRDIVQSLVITLAYTLILAFFAVGAPFKEILSVMTFGFHPQDAKLAEIISGSGFLSMISVILSVILSAVLNGQLDESGMLTALLDKLNKPAKTEWHLMANAAVTSIVLTLVTCNQPICCMATGSYFSPKFDEMHITRRSLAHIISDNGIIISPLVPWNVNALMAVTVTGVATVKYLPFTFLCLILPIFTYINMYRAYKMGKATTKTASM